MELGIEDRREGDLTVVTVAGEVDVATAGQLRDHLHRAIESGRTDLSVDLAGVGFLDSTGLAALVGALRRARSRGGDLRLVNVPERVARILRLTGLGGLFPGLAPADGVSAVGSPGDPQA